MNSTIKARIESIRRGEVPEGYKRTKIGIVPNEWNVEPLKSHLIEYRHLSNDIDKYDIFSSSRNGLMLQSAYYSQKTATQTNLGYKTVPNGYVTYRHMSDDDIFHFNINRQNKTILVSAEYPVFDTDDQTNTYFLITYLNSMARFRYFCRGQKMGGTRTRLYFNVLGDFKLAFPSISEQEKIAEILAGQDRVIALKEKLLAEKQKQKKYLMQQLLTGKKRLPGFSGEWKKYNFFMIFKVLSSQKYQIKKLKYFSVGKYPVIDQGKEFIAGYYNDEEKVIKCPKDGIIVFGDHTREIKFINFDFVVGADGTQLLVSSNESILTYFLYYLLLNMNIPNDGYSRHLKYIKEAFYLVPALKEQTAIAEILSTADKEIELLKKDIEQEKLKKKSLMQLLLTGIVRVL